MYKFVDTNEWVPVHTLPGFEACIEYFVNRNGDIKSTKGKVERLLRHRISKGGYPQVNLTQRIGRGKVKTVTVHTLVAYAFLGPPPTPYGRKVGCSLVDHKDANKANCRADNLQWYSRLEGNTNQDYPQRTSKENTAKIEESDS